VFAMVKGEWYSLRKDSSVVWSFGEELCVRGELSAVSYLFLILCSEC
jgi:hypothetical protein